MEIMQEYFPMLGNGTLRLPALAGEGRELLVAETVDEALEVPLASDELEPFPGAAPSRTTT